MNGFWIGLGLAVGAFFLSLGIETGLTNIAKAIRPLRDNP